MSASVIANDGQDIIFQKIELDPSLIFSSDNLDKDFEIDETVDWILNGDYSRVGLQFPNELLPKAVSIAMILEKKSGRKCAILGDTSFGSCCVDEVAAEHYKVDAMIHYGRTCLSSKPTLPVKFVFGHRSFDVSTASSAITAALSPPSQHQLIVVYDFPLHVAAIELISLLTDSFTKVITSSPDLSDSAPDSETLRRCGRLFPLLRSKDLSNYTLLYLGSQGLPLHNLLLSFPTCKAAFSLDPNTCFVQEESPSTNRLIKRRLHLIERARDAQRVGILVGTLSGQDYRSIIDQVGRHARFAGKAVYTFVVGKLNVAKLANFPEIDVFVLIACPECALLCSREFYRPLITPFELEVACNPERQWTGDIATDFKDLLPGGANFIPLSSNPESLDNDEADVSLITGKVRANRHLVGSQVQEGNNWALLERPQEAWGVAQVQKDKGCWRGLDPRLGETPVASEVVEGRRGIAIGYEEEGGSDKIQKSDS